MNLTSFSLSNLNWDGLTQFLAQNQASWNSALVVLFILIIFFYLGSGLGRTAKGIISVYVALAIVNTIIYFKPDGPEVNVPGMLVVKLGSFVGLSILILMLISRFSFHSVIKVDLPGNIIERLIFSVFGAGMLIAILLSFMPPEIVSTLSPWMQKMFLSNAGLAAWLILPLICLLFVKHED